MDNKIINKKYWYLLFCLFLLMLLVWFFVLTSTTSNTLSVSFLYVGQGDAVFIETPNKNQILIDGGPPNKSVLRELRKKMPFYDRHIDVVIATHPDQDHIGGLIDVLDRYQVGVVLDSGFLNTTGVYLKKEALIKEKNIKRYVARRGMRLALDKNITLDILFPDRNIEGLDTNDASIIARLTYGDHEFLFTGDASQKIEKYIVYLDEDALESDVLKVGHHGSKTSTSGELLSVVAPTYAVISAGIDNRYGHPHQEVLDILQSFNIETLNTQTLGTITFETDGKNLKIK